MDKTDFATLPILSAVTKATITGRSLLESGLIGRFCIRLPLEGFVSLLKHFYPAQIDDERIRSSVGSIVQWYRSNGSPGDWANEPLFDWLISLSPTKDEWLYSMYAALLLCVDRAVVCGVRGRLREAEQWFDCAQWLRFSLSMHGTEENPAVAMARLRHSENYALADDALAYWQEHIDPNLSAQKAATILTGVVPLSHKKLAEIVSEEKNRLSAMRIQEAERKT